MKTKVVSLGVNMGRIKAIPSIKECETGALVLNKRMGLVGMSVIKEELVIAVLSALAEFLVDRSILLVSSRRMKVNCQAPTTDQATTLDRQGTAPRHGPRNY